MELIYVFFKKLQKIEQASKVVRRSLKDFKKDCENTEKEISHLEAFLKHKFHNLTHVNLTIFDILLMLIVKT